MREIKVFQKRVQKSQLKKLHATYGAFSGYVKIFNHRILSIFQLSMEIIKEGKHLNCINDFHAHQVAGCIQDSESFRNDTVKSS